MKGPGGYSTDVVRGNSRPTIGTRVLGQRRSRTNCVSTFGVPRPRGKGEDTMASACKGRCLSSAYSSWVEMQVEVCGATSRDVRRQWLAGVGQMLRSSRCIYVTEGLIRHVVQSPSSCIFDHMIVVVERNEQQVPAHPTKSFGSRKSAIVINIKWVKAM